MKHVDVESGSVKRRFSFRFDLRYQALAKRFGVTPEHAWVEVSDDELRARFGPWRLRTPLQNVASVELTGPYHFVKTAGPARLGVTDLGLTFATNGDRGVLISFRKRVPGIDPLGVLRHGELTVTVAEPDELASALKERIGAGT
jgi:hypothetical protein